MDTTTEFEISASAAESFAASIKRPDKEDNIRIEAIAEGGQTQAPPPRRNFDEPRGKPYEGKPYEGKPQDGKPYERRPDKPKPDYAKPAYKKAGFAKPGFAKPAYAKPNDDGAGKPFGKKKHRKAETAG
jgi:ATP-dependent RNA helicase DeaD